jgi:hypothetical protein
MPKLQAIADASDDSGYDRYHCDIGFMVHRCPLRKNEDV